MTDHARIAKIRRLLQEKQPLPNIAPQHWKPEKLIRRITNNQKLINWLNLKTSLTAKLRRECAELRVEILSETYEEPMLSEAQALGLSITDKAWVRCVLLKCQNQNWVYARTIIPNLQPQNPWHELQTLGTKPLGEILFEMNNIDRSPFGFGQDLISVWPHLNTQISPAKQKKMGYARRSLFQRQQHPLLLTEVFLPDFQDKVLG